MRRGRSVPRQRLAGTACAGASFVERGRVAEQLLDRGDQALHVVPGHDAAGAELAHRLGEAADVVDDRRHAGAEGAHQHRGHVDLRLVRKESDRRAREQLRDLGLGLVRGSPVDRQRARRGPVGLDRFQRLAGDDQPRAVHALRGLDRVAEPLVRTDQADARQRVPVVLVTGLARKDRHRNPAQTVARHAELRQRLEAARAVHDDPVEPRKELSPELLAGHGPARQQVVRGEDERAARTEEPAVERRRGEPLDVQHVARPCEQPRRADRMLQHLHRHAQPRPAEHARRHPVEQLVPRDSRPPRMTRRRSGTATSRARRPPPHARARPRAHGRRTG